MRTLASGLDVAGLVAMDVAGRLGRLRALLEVDAFLVTSPTNIAYLTGFSGSAGSLLVSPRDAVLVTDGRYRDQAPAQLAAASVAADVVIGGRGGQLDALAARTAGTSTLGIEADHISHARYRALAARLAPELVELSGVVESLRIVKDAGEIARVARACEIADEALAGVAHLLAEGVTETEFAAELEYAMRLGGGAGPSFETIVASGPNAAMPHARPTTRRVAEGDLVVVDFGTIVDGYHSDMTRTFAVGDPGARARALLAAVRTAQQAGVDAVRAGATGADVDRACRESLAAASLGELFLHGTGHGVGREIHEAPALSAGSTDSLRAGMVVTVEPGAYEAGLGGVRIEDTLVVAEGGARVLTAATKDDAP